MEKNLKNDDSKSFVRTLSRGLRVIETLGSGKGSTNIANIAQETDLSRSAVKRYLQTLTELGYTSTDGRTFSLTPKVLNLGLSYLYSIPFWRQAQLLLEELSQEIKHSCAMSILDGNEIVYVVRVPMYQILRSSPTLGSRLPANAVSMGRALLAESSNELLDHFLNTAPLKRLTSRTITDPKELYEKIMDARDKGFAWVDSELDESICGLAIVVRNLDGKALAAINVSLPSGYVTEAQAITKYLPTLRDTAATIRRAL